MRMTYLVRAAICTTIVGCAFASSVDAQGTGRVTKSQSDGSIARAPKDSVTVVAGQHYKAGDLYRWFFGNTYRDLWTTPMRVPVFDWHTYAGGLHPTKEGGGNQTKSLRFEAKDGSEYVFRVSDKTVNSAPAQVKGTPVAAIIQDEVSAQHPAGAEIAAPIVEASGVLHPTPVLMVMPDDSALGKFRDDFAGKLGMVEAFPNVPKEAAGFGGATKIIDSEDLLKLLNTDSKEHVDARTFLTARLTDFLINDNDRHGGNWKWARLPSEPKTEWEPIARDRDHAFVSLDGVLMSLARRAEPTLVAFDNSPSVPGLTQPRGFDARLLAGLEKPVWDSVALALQAKITDSVIEAATRAMPIEYQGSARRLAAVLEARRAALPKLADEFYHILAKRVAIHGTDGPDHVAITRAGDGHVDVRLESKGTAYFARRFDARETSELLVYLHGGDDTAVVVGTAGRSILIRVIGGNGTNALVDSSTVAGHAHPTRLYDVGTVTGVSYGADTAFDRLPWEALNDTLGPHLADDGGSLSPAIGLNEHRGVGLTPFVSITKYSYGFSQRPYASMLKVEGEYATQVPAGRVGVTVDHRFESSPVHVLAFARMSDFEVLNFSGFGNATPDAVGGNEYFAVRQRQWLFRPAVAVLRSRDSAFDHRQHTQSLPVGDAPLRLRHVRSSWPPARRALRATSPGRRSGRGAHASQIAHRRGCAIRPRADGSPLGIRDSGGHDECVERIAGANVPVARRAGRRQEGIRRFSVLRSGDDRWRRHDPLHGSRSLRGRRIALRDIGASCSAGALLVARPRANRNSWIGRSGPSLRSWQFARRLALANRRRHLGRTRQCVARCDADTHHRTRAGRRAHPLWIELLMRRMQGAAA